MNELDTRKGPLSAALRTLAEDDARLEASEAVKGRLLAEVRARARSRRRRRERSGLAAAAAVVLTATIASSWRIGLGPADVGQPSDVATGEMATEFFPLAYATVPITSGHILRLEVSQRMLASFGVSPADAVGGSSAGVVMADVLVGEDGLARAVRFVRPEAGATEKEQQP